MGITSTHKIAIELNKWENSAQYMTDSSQYAQLIPILFYIAGKWAQQRILQGNTSWVGMLYMGQVHAAIILLCQPPAPHQRGLFIPHPTITQDFLWWN